MTAILTHSGRLVDLLDVQPAEIDLNDIAHALAQTCRFGGHTKRHYSVAEHSLNVARLLPEPIKIYGLLHDAHEAYIGDISTPMKRTLDEYWSATTTIQIIARDIDNAIYSALGVPPPGTLICDAVKYADATMAVKEMRELFDKQPPAGQWGVDETLPVPDWNIDDWGIPFSDWGVAFRRAVEALL